SRITVMAQTPDGYLWLGTELGLLRFDGVRIVPWQPPPGQSLPPIWVRSLYVGRDGTLWIGTLGGLASWKEGTLRRYPGVTFRVDTLLEDRRGTVWAGGSDATPFGRRLCAIQPGSLQCHGEDSSLGRGVSSLYEDPAGALWVAADTGLWRWTPGPPKFYPLTESVAGLQSLTRGDDGTPLISTRSGISQLVNEKIASFPLPPGALPLRSPKLFRDRDGGLWLGSDSGLLHVHRGRTDAFTRFDGLSADSVSRFFEDREGNIWVATLDGVDRFRELAATTFSVSQGLSQASVMAVLSSKEGRVWLNTGGFLNRWKNRHITVYRNPGDSLPHGPERPTRHSPVREIVGDGLPGRDLGSIFQDNRGRIWVAWLGGLGYLENDR